jgi:hypothetical protein
VLRTAWHRRLADLPSSERRSALIVKLVQPPPAVVDLAPLQPVDLPGGVEVAA